MASHSSTPTVPASEGIGLAAAVVILLIAFGSVVAMGLPIISALIGIGLSLSMIPLVSSVLPTADFTTTVAAMIGLGVGIDYALFMVTRYRTELASGRDVSTAIAVAVRTSGRAIVFAGGTVMVSLLGLLLIGMEFLKGFAVASSLTVAIAVAAAVTLVPALLAIIGRRIDRLSIHRRAHVDDQSRHRRPPLGAGHPATSGDCRDQWHGDPAAGRPASAEHAAGDLRRRQQPRGLDHAESHTTASQKASAPVSTVRCWSSSRRPVMSPRSSRQVECDRRRRLRGRPADEQRRRDQRVHRLPHDRAAIARDGAAGP